MSSFHLELNYPYFKTLKCPVIFSHRNPRSGRAARWTSVWTHSALQTGIRSSHSHPCTSYNNKVSRLLFYKHNFTHFIKITITLIINHLAQEIDKYIIRSSHSHPCTSCNNKVSCLLFYKHDSIFCRAHRGGGRLRDPNFVRPSVTLTKTWITLQPKARFRFGAKLGW